IDLKVGENRAWGFGRLEGRIFREGISSWAGISFEVEKRGEQLRGSFKGELRDVNAFQFSYPKGSFEGRVEGQKVFFSFDLKDGLVGRGYYDYKNTSYSLEGSLKHVQGSLLVASEYRLNGKGRDLHLEISGDGRYKNYSFPLNASLHIKEGRLEALMRGFILRTGIIFLKVPDVKAYGSTESGSIEVNPLTVGIGQEMLARVEFQRGEYKGKTLSLRGKMYGALEGWLDFSYNGKPRLSSEGMLDIGKLFSVIRSRVLADAECKVSYRLSYTDSLNLKAGSEKITLRSRYLAVPLSGRLEVIFRDNRLSGFVSLIGNRRTSILANFTGDNKFAQLSFEVLQLPLLYRNDTIRTSLFISGKGVLSSDYKNLSIKGDFYTSGVINLQRIKGRSGETPEEYKRVSLEISLASSEPLRVNLPEGFVYTDVSAKIKGTLYEPDYVVNTYLRGGALTYFEREFYVKRG
ncbi:MAG: hypothetical protein WKI48_05815, partial [Aquificaceae bacterium]